MTNEDFQDIVRKGDILVTGKSIRWRPGERYKFEKFDYCKHSGSRGCHECKGSMVIEEMDGSRRSDCGREYNNGKTMDYLVVKMEIIGSTEWLNEEDWNI